MITTIFYDFNLTIELILWTFNSKKHKNYPKKVHFEVKNNHAVLYIPM